MHSKKWMAPVLALSLMLSTAPAVLAEAAEPPAIRAEIPQGETVKAGENTVKPQTKLNFTPTENGYYGFATQFHSVFSYSEEIKACRKGHGSFMLNEYYYDGDIFYLEQGKTYSFSLDKLDNSPDEYTLGIFKMKEPNDMWAEKSVMSYLGKENDTVLCDFRGQISTFSEISAESSDPAVASVWVEENTVRVNVHKVGLTKITMTTKNGLKKTCDYRVVEPIPVTLNEAKEVDLGQGGILSFTPEETEDYVLCIPKDAGYDYVHRYAYGQGGSDFSIGNYIRSDFHAEAGKTYYLPPIIFNPDPDRGEPAEPGPISVFVKKIVPVESMEIVPCDGTDPDSIYPDGQFNYYTFRVKTTPLYTRGKITWSVSDSNVAKLAHENSTSTIEYGGMVELIFHAAGEVTLTATTENGVKASVKLVCKDADPINLDEKLDIQQMKKLLFTAPEDGHYLIKSDGISFQNLDSNLNNSFFYQDDKNNHGFAFSAKKGEAVKIMCRKRFNANSGWISISKMPELESVNLPEEITVAKEDPIFFPSYCQPAGCYVDLPNVEIDIESPEVVTLDEECGLGALKALREGSSHVKYTMPDGTVYTTTIRVKPVYDKFTQDEIQMILTESEGQKVLKLDTIQHEKATEIVEIDYNDFFGTVAEKFDELEFICENGTIRLDRKALEHLRNEKCTKVQMGILEFHETHSLEYPSLEGKKICANYSPLIRELTSDGKELPIDLLGEGTAEYIFNFTPLKDISAYELHGLAWPMAEGADTRMDFTYTEGQISVKASQYIPWFSVAEKPDGWQYDHNGWFYMENGRKAVSTWKMDSLGWCYLNAEGYLTTNAWAEDSAGWCYLDESGHTLTNSWKSDSHGWCYLDGDGRMLKSSWVQDTIGWCYLDADGYLMTNAWAEDSAGWCYLDENGHTLTNSWKSDSHGWCYLDGDGRMLKSSWVRDSIGWCCLNADGYLMTNAWAEDSAGWCYLDENGHTLTNSWKSDSHGWCYLDGDGRMLKNNWAQDSIGWCYLDADGYMLTNGYAYDSAGQHYLDASGHMVW